MKHAPLTQPQHGIEVSDLANIIGTKWGSSELGTAGGTVTWSIAAAGTDISRFGFETQTSVSGESFLDYDFVQMISDAFAEWSKYGDIEFQQVEDQGGAAGVGVDADIRIYFGAIPGGTAGYAFYPSSYGSAIAGDILLDTLDKFNNDPVLFFNLLLHEIGHTLGLGHVSGDSIMQSSIKKIGLQADDIAGIQEIYGVQDDVIGQNETGSAQDGSDQPQDAPNDTDQSGDEHAAEDPNHTDPNDAPQTDEGQTTSDPEGDDHTHEEDGHSHDGHDHDGHSHDPDQNAPALSLLEGDETKNKIVATNDADLVNGLGGNDTLRGEAGDDTLNGGDGNDKILGGVGNDILSGQNGNDTLKGNAGADQMNGGEGDDLLKGGRGEDTLNGGTGDDTLFGRGHADTFEFADNHGHDIIKDFAVKNDDEKIDLTGLSGLNDFGDVMSALSQSGGDLVIDTGANSSITLENVDIAHLDANDFLF